MENESSEPIKIKKNTPLCQIRELKDVPEKTKNWKKQFENREEFYKSDKIWIIVEDDLEDRISKATWWLALGIRVPSASDWECTGARSRNDSTIQDNFI